MLYVVSASPVCSSVTNCSSVDTLANKFVIHLCILSYTNRVVPFLHLRIINTLCCLQSIQSNTILQSVHRFSTGISRSGYKYRNYARASAIQHLNMHNFKLQTTNFIQCWIIRTRATPPIKDFQCTANP